MSPAEEGTRTKQRPFNASGPEGPCPRLEDVHLGLRGPLLDLAVMAPGLVV